VYYIQQNRSLDAQVDKEYKRLQSFNKGKQLYFYNIKNPFVYKDNRLLKSF
jgi:hypothetical protein